MKYHNGCWLLKEGYACFHLRKYMKLKKMIQK